MILKTLTDSILQLSKENQMNEIKFLEDNFIFSKYTTESNEEISVYEFLYSTHRTAKEFIENNKGTVSAEFPNNGKWYKAVKRYNGHLENTIMALSIFREITKDLSPDTLITFQIIDKEKINE